MQRSISLPRARSRSTAPTQPAHEANVPHGTEEGEVTDDGASANSREAEGDDYSSVVSGGESTPSRVPDQRERCFIEWLKEVPGSDFPDATYLKIIDVSPLCGLVRCSFSPLLLY